MLSDYTGDDSEDYDAMIYQYTCPNCGMSYQITDTPNIEKADYPYWNKKQ